MRRIGIKLSVAIIAATLASCLGDQLEFKERPKVDPPVPVTFEKFASGADISGVTEFEAKGVKFYNKDGQERECTVLIKELGFDAIRLRVFVDHPNDLCEKEDVLEKARRVRDLGLRLMIDFHYSDDFADPGKQNIPAAWIDYNLGQMTQAVTDHTKDVLSALKAESIDVEWVQVGNETRGGMLWPMGNIDKNMGQYAVLTQAGYEAVKAIYPEAKVIVHIDKADELGLYTRIFDGLQLNSASWDMIGMSFYPEASSWESQTDAVVNNIITLSEKYGKPCMIVETGMKRDDTANGKEFFEHLFDRMMNDTKGYCQGIFYWEPETYRESGYDKGAFDDNGKPTEMLNPFNKSQYE